jgi:hypothetical protein
MVKFIADIVFSSQNQKVPTPAGWDTGLAANILQDIWLLVVQVGEVFPLRA